MGFLSIIPNPYYLHAALAKAIPRVPLAHMEKTGLSLQPAELGAGTALPARYGSSLCPPRSSHLHVIDEAEGLHPHFDQLKFVGARTQIAVSNS